MAPAPQAAPGRIANAPDRASSRQINLQAMLGQVLTVR